jgi:hypothetical protein
VLWDFFDGFSFPIVFGLRSGHGDANLSIRLSAHIERTARLARSESAMGINGGDKL